MAKLEKCERCGALVGFGPNPHHPHPTAVIQCWELYGRSAEGHDVFIEHTPARCTQLRTLALGGS